MREYTIIVDNPNLDQPTQEDYNRLFKLFSNTTYKMNPDKFKILGKIIIKKEE